MPAVSPGRGVPRAAGRRARRRRFLCRRRGTATASNGRDKVFGAGEWDTWPFVVAAQQLSNRSTAATGWLLTRPGGGDIVGNAACIDVRDGRATVSGTLAEGTMAVDRHGRAASSWRSPLVGDWDR